MAKLLYCWRCKTDVPMLDEQEWEQVHPVLSDMIQQIKRYRERTGASLAEAKKQGFGAEALERYFEITGYRATDPKALWHHRLERFGPPCTVCGKLLRTPRARMCAECGTPVKLHDAH